jgi:hypothetical protein
MVLARILAELSVLICLALLPLIIFALGKFALLAMPLKILFGVLSGFSFLLLPVYGFITYQVRLTDDELIASCLFAQHRCKFAQIKALSRRSTWNFVRYVVEFEGGELTFPVWLKQCDLLVSILRDKLPAGAAGKCPMDRTFRQDVVALLFQLAQVLLSLVFIGVVWYFAFSVKESSKLATADVYLVYAFAAMVAVALLYRAWCIFLIPTRVQITDQGFSVKTMLFVRSFLWEELQKVAPALPLLPEGFVIHTRRGNFLVGHGMNFADELEKALKGKLESKVEATQKAPVVEAAPLVETREIVEMPDDSPPASQAKSETTNELSGEPDAQALELKAQIEALTQMSEVPEINAESFSNESQPRAEESVVETEGPDEPQSEVTQAKAEETDEASQSEN